MHFSYDYLSIAWCGEPKKSFQYFYPMLAHLHLAKSLVQNELIRDRPYVHYDKTVFIMFNQSKFQNIYSKVGYLKKC